MGTGTSVSRELRDRITGCLSPVIPLFTLHRRQPILHSSLFTLHFQKGPYPIQLVVVIAVTNAVSAATIIFTAISIIRFFFIAE